MPASSQNPNSHVTKIKGEVLVNDFFKNFKQLNFHKKEFLYRPGESVKNIYFIEEGYVAQQIFLPNGERFIVNVFRPNSYIPISFALTGVENEYWFEAITPVVVRKAPTSQVTEFLDGNSHVLQELLLRLSSGLNHFTLRMEMLAFKKAKEKVMTTLYWASQRYGKVKRETIVIDFPLTHSRLAALAGITRETTSKIMMELKKEKVIDYRKKEVIVFDQEKLKIW